MAIKKIIGIETEYGITAKGKFATNPVSASSFLVNSYAHEMFEKNTKWDFTDEQPGRDARGFLAESSGVPLIETQLINVVLYNGARFYVDHAHPEYSSPECGSPLEATLYDAAGQLVLRKAMAKAKESLNDNEEIVVYKNNSDGKGNSYGCHENYLMDRTIPFSKIVDEILPFLVTRQIFCGAGKVGCENSKEQIEFQISQRADFFEEIVGLETTTKRPLVNTRDEPHANSDKFRRLHLILGDANMSQTSTFLKLGSTALVLAMIEDNSLFSNAFRLADPVREIKRVSHDINLSHLLTTDSADKISAIDIQYRFLEAAQNYVLRGGGEFVGGDEIAKNILELWEDTLDKLAVDPMKLNGTVDWVAKYRLVSAYRQRHDLKWNSDKLAAIDLQYHDIREEKSLARLANLETLFSTAEIRAAENEPPHSTRAYFRGKILSKWPANIVSANWDSIVFDLGGKSLKKIPMLDPMKGSFEIVANLIDETKTVAELIDKLEA